VCPPSRKQEISREGGGGVAGLIPFTEPNFFILCFLKKSKPGAFRRRVLVGSDRGLLEVEVAAVALLGLGLRPRHPLLAHRRLLLHHGLVIALL
jgi:hypothetical protein